MNITFFLHSVPNHVITMISNIANRVTTAQLLQQFTALTEMLMEAGYITQNSIVNYQSTAQNNLNWLAANIVEIESVISDGTVTAPTTMPSTISTPLTTSQMPQTTTGGAESIVLSSIVLLCSIAMKFFKYY